MGESGGVCQYLKKALASNYEVVGTTRESLDLADTKSIQASLSAFDVDLVINPAAYTAVDAAEENQTLAYAINRDAPGEIAEYCATKQIPLVHFSTDYVFDGDAEVPYTESDATNPQGVYGASKLAGENAIIESGAPAIVLRTAWVYSNVGKNFYKTMCSLAETRDELGVVSDQIGSPTYAGSIANAVAELVDIIASQGGISDEQLGVYHLTCGDQTSWHGFAEKLLRDNGFSEIKVNPIPSSAYPTPAKRPAFSVLSNAKLANVFGVELPDWQTALADCIAESTVKD
jgi:dTDP-4-dehydrorhamnose reductase